MNRGATQELVENHEITIGDWCLFEIESSLLVGMLLSFCYRNGKTLKDRAYSKTSANITDVIPIGVLATWYSWVADGTLIVQSKSTHSFVSIKNYKGTTPKQSYSGKVLKLNPQILLTLNDLA